MAHEADEIQELLHEDEELPEELEEREPEAFGTENFLEELEDEDAIPGEPDEGDFSSPNGTSPAMRVRSA